MLRKTIFAFAAAATLGAAALAPTSASANTAWGWGWYDGWYGHGFRVYAGPFYNDCVAQRWISTKHGHVLRWVNVCY
jgi:hypothetical protein